MHSSEELGGEQWPEGGKPEDPALAICQLGHRRACQVSQPQSGDWADSRGRPRLQTWPWVSGLVSGPPRLPERMRTGPGVVEPGSGLGREMTG